MDAELQLYAHPFSSYSQKVLLALYEWDLPFVYRHLEDAHAAAEWEAAWPIKRFPVLRHGQRWLMESSVIVEYLQGLQSHGLSLIPAGELGLEVRMYDRIFDNYVHTPMQKIVLNQLRPETERDAYGVAEAKKQLEQSYIWLNAKLEGRQWLVGEAWSLVECAAAPALFYADWAHPVAADLPLLRAYRARLLARPSMQRVVDEARPYRAYFPLGAPNRD